MRVPAIFAAGNIFISWPGFLMWILQWSLADIQLPANSTEVGSPGFSCGTRCRAATSAHSISKKEAVRNCEKCHSQPSPFFNAVAIILGRDDGRADQSEP
jgi:hypothetical protein